MNYKIVIQSQAEHEIDSICKYYNSKSVGLARSFINELQIHIEKIKAMPSRYRVYVGSIQYVNLNTFPYQIFYEVDETAKMIYIRAIYHARKDPKNKLLE